MYLYITDQVGAFFPPQLVHLYKNHVVGKIHKATKDKTCVGTLLMNSILTARIQLNSRASRSVGTRNDTESVVYTRSILKL